ncbi:MAG: hypothetical protein CTY22_11175, partial [Methylomonas sp.]
FELQAVDWKKQQDIPMTVFKAQFDLLKRKGARHIGYYPDNLHRDHPKVDELKTFFPVARKD